VNISQLSNLHQMPYEGQDVAKLCLVKVER